MSGQAAGRDGIPGQYDHTARTGLELYDLSTDIGERRDVSEDHPDVVERLTALADAKRQELGDSLTGVEGHALRKPGVASLR